MLNRAPGCRSNRPSGDALRARDGPATGLGTRSSNPLRPFREMQALLNTPPPQCLDGLLLKGKLGKPLPARPPPGPSKKRLSTEQRAFSSSCAGMLAFQDQTKTAALAIALCVGTASPMAIGRQSFARVSLSNQLISILVRWESGGETGGRLPADFPSWLSLLFVMRRIVSRNPWRTLWGVYPSPAPRRLSPPGGVGSIRYPHRAAGRR